MLESLLSADIPAEVRAAYEPVLARTQIVIPLENAGGMSGSRIFRLRTVDSDFCLRHWSVEHPTPRRLAAIHTAISTAAGQGVSFLAVPLENCSGQSATWVANHAWELAPWLPGTADYHTHPSRERLTAAMHALAELHQVWLDQPWTGFDEPPLRTATAPGLTQRVRWLRQLFATEFDQLGHLVQQAAPTRLRELALQVLANFPPLAARWQRDLFLAAEIAVPLQVCLRDVWHDHVLFVGDRVSGIIDYGAMNIDTPVADLARLLDSFVADDEVSWNLAFDSYSDIRPLSFAERTLCRAYQRSSILLTGLQWIMWLFREKRQFAPGQAEERLKHALCRMQAAIASKTFLGG